MTTTENPCFYINASALIVYIIHTYSMVCNSPRGHFIALSGFTWMILDWSLVFSQYYYWSILSNLGLIHICLMFKHFGFIKYQVGFIQKKIPVIITTWMLTWKVYKLEIHNYNSSVSTWKHLQCTLWMIWVHFILVTFPVQTHYF